MKLEFYSVSDDPRKAQKTLGNVVHTVNNAAIYRECSLLTPEFLVEYSPSVVACNYLYAGVTIGETTYGSYYFIKDRIVMPGGRMVVICEEDVLSTWWHKLKDCTANVIRQESEAHFSSTSPSPSRFISDPYMVGKVNTNFNHVPFPNSTTMFKIPNEGNEYSYVLTVLGGLRGTPPESTTKAGDEND